MPINLKPAKLITTNKIVPVSKVVTDLNKNIPKNSDEPVTTYLKMLIDMYTTPSKAAEKKIKDYYAANKKAITADMSKIKNDFGEILGGIAAVNRNLLAQFYPTTNFVKGSLEYPTAQNEPLKDYSIHVGGKEYIISAKIAGATSNTVKPQDVMKLINQSSAITAQRKKELFSTIEYKVLDILGQENTMCGPIKALSYLCHNVKDVKKKKALEAYIDVKSFPEPSSVLSDLLKINANINTSQQTSNPYKGTIFKSILKSKQFAAYSSGRGIGDPPTWADIVLFCEYSLEKISRAKILNFGDLFIDAITSQIHYVKMSIDTFGIPKFEAYASVRTNKGKGISNFDAGSIYIRSKSSMYKDGRYRLKDKMGIQT